MKLLKQKTAGKLYYTLLGLDNQDLFVSGKITDVLCLNDNRRSGLRQVNVSLSEQTHVPGNFSVFCQSDK